MTPTVSSMPDCRNISFRTHTSSVLSTRGRGYVLGNKSVSSHVLVVHYRYPHLTDHFVSYYSSLTTKLPTTWSDCFRTSRGSHLIIQPICNRQRIGRRQWAVGSSRRKKSCRWRIWPCASRLASLEYGYSTIMLSFLVVAVESIGSLTFNFVFRVDCGSTWRITIMWGNEDAS